MTSLSSPHERMKPHYKVAVIGSGYGGGVAASRLARGGCEVAVFERGREFAPGDFPDNLLKMTKEVQADLPELHLGSPLGLFDLRFNSDINVIVGCGLGGTSLINANISLEPDARIFADSHWPEAIRTDAANGAFSPHFSRGLTMLGATPYPHTAPRTAKLASMERLAQRFGQTLHHPPINVTFTDGPNAVGVEQRACIGCGDCVSGCNHLAKNTVAMNYLPDAVRHGAEIFTRVRLEYVERDGHAWRLHLRRVAELAESREDFVVTAEIVVLAAGTLGSSEILLRSRDRGLRLSPALGTRFSGNGDMLALAYNCEQTMNAIGWGHRSATGRDPVGPCSVGMIDLRNTASLDDGKMMADGALTGALAVALPKALAAGAKLTGDRTEHGAFNIIRAKLREMGSLLLGPYVGAARRTITYLVVAHDDSGGQLYLDGNRLRVSWPDAGAAPVFEEASQLIHRAAAADGGTYVRSPVWNRWNGQQLFTGHPLGGCPMADDGRRGVVNDKGQVFAAETGEVHPGLYVMDAAVIPRSLGVNPLLTITALAERSCAELARDRGWTVAHEDMPARMAGAAQS